MDDKIINRIFYVFNPSTSQYRILSPCPSREDGFEVGNASLAFDPLKSPHYEVVCVLSKEDKIFQIDIYSSKTASWRRRSGETFSNKPFLHTKSGVFWNGSLHWVHVTSYPGSTSLKESFVYFDVDREILMDMPVPQIPEGKSWNKKKIGYFGEYKGHLHLIPNYDEYDADFYIFEMEDNHYKQWNLKYRVNLAEVLIACPETFFDNERLSWENEDLYEQLFGLKFSILLVEEEGGGGESSTILIHIPDKIISYDLKNMSIKETHDLPLSLFHTGPSQTLLLGAHQYIESLACV
ncbi:F-box protein At5g07610-like [Papaver somniferum]|nr:F-box protein At5g07610-like [Papaver somniferum]